MKNYNINFNFIRLLFLLLFCSVLSGCLSTSLFFVTEQDRGTHRSDWGADTITALSLASDSNGNTGWVFVGKHYDYLLTEGGDNAVNILKDPTLFRDKITVKNTAEFIISSEDKKFDGSMELIYHWSKSKDKFAAMDYGFSCQKNEISCSLLINNLVGTIHQKNKEQDVAYLLQFYHPFEVSFYEYKPDLIAPKAARVLLPVTLAIDVVTLPLQFLFIASKR